MEFLHRGKVEAVHRIDIDEFLESLGFLDKIRAGEINCSSCDDIVQVENITRIILHRDQPEFICKDCSTHWTESG